MIVLTIRTDRPESEIGLFKDGEELVYKKWQAHRQLAETINTTIYDVLSTAGLADSDLDAIVAYRGPGSFTGLRIGVSVANALAHGLNIIIVGSEGDDWIQNGIEKIKTGNKRGYVVPEYGAPVFTTKPKK